MDILKQLLSCSGTDYHSLANDSHTSDYPTDEKVAAFTDVPSTIEAHCSADKTGDKILHLILTAPALNTPASNAQIQEIINSGQPDAVTSSSWWRNAVIKRVYNGFKVLVANVEEHGDTLSDALRTLFMDAKAFADEFMTEHPYITCFIELVALALLIEVLTPALLGALGFCGEGVLEGASEADYAALTPRLSAYNSTGSFAAWWQSSIGDVPYGSLFSKLQSLAARYGKSLPIK
ncbi:hypothetical protein D6C76_02456 [Aureobasidium pullulans]|uniref:Uncharacterized protein n=1 Tax=Aureobasidium pullulans TaxID=5580 RepID=A0A4S9IBE4_AURPU|nr:hypothetical protein D6D12_07416 [Aureobasidium pullulans]THX42148.1 hypothetical protein D6D11_08327 [Aureobasidium pullulans]THX86205.1 hypothetical protein D6D04_01526 [Aureobasidium pullulans]TIA82396.1 hypothetical protein D6C76_02456 [Aureobasidium pullulans]